VRDAALVVFELTGDGIDKISKRLRGAPGVESATIFGQALRVVGLDRAAMLASIERLKDDAGVEEVPARLDDVFIHLLQDQEEAA